MARGLESSGCCRGTRCRAIGVAALLDLLSWEVSPSATMAATAAVAVALLLI